MSSGPGPGCSLAAMYLWEIAEKLGLIKTRKMTDEELDEYVKMMEDKGFHFTKDCVAVGAVMPACPFFKARGRKCSIRGLHCPEYHTRIQMKY